jgi:hypothetical protein
MLKHIISHIKLSFLVISQVASAEQYKGAFSGVVLDSCYSSIRQVMRDLADSYLPRIGMVGHLCTASTMLHTICNFLERCSSDCGMAGIYITCGIGG